MLLRIPGLSILVRILVSCVILVGLVLTNQTTSSGRSATPVQAVAAMPPDSLAARETAMPEPTVALALSPATATPVPVPPTPTPLPKPEWAQARVDTPLRSSPEPGSAALEFVPAKSYLKVVQYDASRMLAYYGGNGDDHKPAEGWIGTADVSLTPAPRWVQARRAALVRSDMDGGGQVGSLPDRAVAEVLEDHGRSLRVFYLGDGFSRPQSEGWVDAAALGPAGPLLVSERYGLRILTKAEVQALDADASRGKWLRVPYRSQLDGTRSEGANCGPSSVGMSLQFFGLPVPTADLRRLADRLQGTSDPDGGFQIEFLEWAVERVGMKGLDLGGSGLNYKRWSLDDARKHLREGHPVVVQLRFKAMPGRESVKYLEDHYVVLAGVVGDDFIYNDSVDTDGPGYARVISGNDLKYAWESSFYPFAGFAIAAP